MNKAETLTLIQSLKNIEISENVINAIVTAVVSGIPYEPPKKPYIKKRPLHSGN